MGDKRMTAIDLKQFNQNKIYQAIYREKAISKMQLVQSLEMGLSTVSQNLKELESAGLIKRDGYFDSTGGRKAQTIRIDPTARVAIGLGILKDMVHCVAIDLYGRVLCRQTVALPYASDEDYYQGLGTKLEQFLQNHRLAPSSILGVSVATQGIISKDGSSVDYGTIMGNARMALANFEAHIPFPCRLEHDSKAAAVLERWNHPEVSDAVVLLLNRNMGGAVIAGGAVQYGAHMRSGLLEHICIQPDGPLCYCGKRGCLETYCSAERLEAKAGMNAKDFFSVLRQGAAPGLKALWSDYLDCLAFAIRNLSMVLDGTFILSGYLAPYFTGEDVASLLDRVNQSAPFPLEPAQLILGEQGQYTPAVGGALYYVKQFLAGV